MLNQIYDKIVKKYGHLDLSEMKAAMRNDGLGELADLLEEMNEEGELGEEGINPSFDIPSIPLSANDNMKFDSRACLAKCAGTCCKAKNYLMITLYDIHRILSSRAAELFQIRSTRDLFEGDPPFLELLIWEEHRMYFPYIRFLPIGADPNTKPEFAKDSVCPFLYPINEVYAFHKEELPKWANNNSMGCMLSEDKPSVCRLSPLGVSTGITGKVTYQYMQPTLECPACETDVEIKVSDYASSFISPFEIKHKERAHQILRKYGARKARQLDQARYYEILKHVYNIDELLFHYGLGVEDRPHIDKLMEMVIAGAKGDFSVYDQFIETLKT